MYDSDRDGRNLPKSSGGILASLSCNRESTSDGAEIAREIADITVGADSLHELVLLKQISDSLMRRIHKNYRTIVEFNTALIILGMCGVLPPTVSALLHNTSTLVISLNSMRNLLPEKVPEK